MTKDELIESLAEGGLVSSKADAKIVIDGVFSNISTALSNGEEIKLHGFGIFKTKDRKARIGRNPATGDQVKIPAKRVVAFSVSKQLKDLINQ